MAASLLATRRDACVRINFLLSPTRRPGELGADAATGCRGRVPFLHGSPALNLSRTNVSGCDRPDVDAHPRTAFLFQIVELGPRTLHTGSVQALRIAPSEIASVEIEIVIEMASKRRRLPMPAITNVITAPALRLIILPEARSEWFDLFQIKYILVDFPVVKKIRYLLFRRQSS
ncbi:hypothetical protein EVAR_59845_1 [Eumeta japonica]|uniref:Uncharacterized protein n=1 Tax=Eumeta variegata TaxID=151549 RepID=A0A4C1ZA49_EUMVA|nr:hypothetical protein EVAR_59845_1 [Eumeta japonica]